MHTPRPNSLSRAAISVLIILQVIMLAALMTKTPPHPPLFVAPFALGPFLGASIAIAVAALVLDAATVAGVIAALLAAVLALVSFGPQKWIDPAIGQIWPAVLLAEIAVIVVAVSVFRSLRRTS